MTRIVLTLTLAFTFCLAACSSDDPTSPGSAGNIGDSDQATADGIAYGIVLPLIRDIFIDTYIDQIPTGGTAVPSILACSPLEICSAGSAEICTDQGTFDLNFTNCDLAGTQIHGSVSMNIGQTSGSGTFSLTLGGNISLSGTVSYDDTECFNQSFSNVVITANGLTINMGGVITWCEPRSMVSGVVVPTSAFLVFTIPSLDRVVDVNITETPAGSVDLLIQNIARNNIHYICDGNILGSGLSCATGTE